MGIMLDTRIPGTGIRELAETEGMIEPFIEERMGWKNVTPPRLQDRRAMA